MTATKDIFASYDKFKDHAVKVSQHHHGTGVTYVGRDDENNIIVSMELDDMMGRKRATFKALDIETGKDFAHKTYTLTKHQLGALFIKAKEDFPVINL